MRSGDLSLRPQGLEAKHGAQRAVGDRGQSPLAAEGTVPAEMADGVHPDGQVMGEKSHGQSTTAYEGGEQGQMQMGMEDGSGNVEKRAMVGHLKAD